MKKRWYSSSSVALGLSAASNARGRSDFLGRLAHGGVRGVRAGTRRPRTHGGTTRVFSSLFRLVAVVFVVVVVVVVVLCRNDASSIDRSTVVVSRYWTPRACGRDHSPVARGTKNGNAGGVVARVARTLSNNTNLLVVSIHHHHHHHR